MPKFADLTGKVFGRLTVLARAPRDKRSGTRWVCRCSCTEAADLEVRANSLVSGATKSCGCLHRESSQARIHTALKAKAQWQKLRAQAILSAGEKKCPNCAMLLKLDQFHTCNTQMGYRSWCRSCCKLAHRENPIKKLWTGAKARARRYGLEYDDMPPADLVVPQYCPIMRHVLIVGDTDWGPSVDRIDPSRGYVNGNVCIISLLANRMKSNGTPEQMILIGEAGKRLLNKTEGN